METLTKKKTIEVYFKEIGEKDPYKVAHLLGIDIDFRDDAPIPDEVIGLYSQTRPDTERYWIYLNSKHEFDDVDSVCIKLIEHHLHHPGIMKCISTTDKCNGKHVNVTKRVYFITRALLSQSKYFLNQKA